MDSATLDTNLNLINRGGFINQLNLMNRIFTSSFIAWVGQTGVLVNFLAPIEPRGSCGAHQRTQLTEAAGL